MEEIAVLISMIIAFAATVFIIPIWIKKAKQVRLLGKDMNKYDKPEVAEGGGVVFVLGTIFAVLFYIFTKTFYFGQGSNNVEIFAIALTLLLAGFVGFMDDMLGWKVGITRRNKILLTIPICIPLVVINSGESLMNIPVFGFVQFGILYPLVIVPIGVIGASNGYNMLAGFNGLEAGMGVIILSMLGFISCFVNGNLWLAAIAFSAVGALLGFLIFNWCPAKVFPGDSLTYSVGALIAAVAILGNMEKIALFLFIPFILDALLSLWPELRGKGKVEAFGRPKPDGTLAMPYKSISDMTHVSMKVMGKLKKNVRESDVTGFLLAVEAALAVIAFFVFI